MSTATAKARIRKNRRWGTLKNCSQVKFPISPETKELLARVTAAGHCGIGEVIELLIKKISEQEPDPAQIAAWLKS